MKKISALLLCIFLLAVTAINISAANDESYDGLYVVFGDSIAAGYGLDDSEFMSDEAYAYVAGRNSDAYAGIVARALDYALENFAKSGATSSDLVLTVQRDDVLATVKDADLVTVSIGGNDIIGKVSTILPVAISHKLFGSSSTNEAIDAIYSDLYDNLCFIMKTITDANGSKGSIMLQRLYNPFKYNPSYTVDLFGESFNFGELIDEYIDRINETYVSVQNDVGGFELIDTDAALNADERSFYDSSRPDFHPTAFGHQLIAQVILKAYAPEDPENPEPEETTTYAETTTEATTEAETEITAEATTEPTAETTAEATIEPTIEITTETAAETEERATSEALTTAKTAAPEESAEFSSEIAPESETSITETESSASETTAKPSKSSGCGSALGAGAVMSSVCAALAASAVAAKKKSGGAR